MEELKAPGVRKCLIDRDSTAITLVRLIVFPEQRSRGHGGKMVERVKALSKAQRKPVPVRLTLDPESPEKLSDLKRFYRKHGFAMMSDNETMIWYP